MSKTKTYIELNGATYDATTGSMLKQTPKSAGPDIPSNASKGQAIDGVVRRSPVELVIKPEPKPVAKIAHQRSANHKPKAAHRKAQRSGTLMRQVVRKPAFTDLLHAKAAPLAAAGDITLANSGSMWPALKPQRLNRAQNVAKSTLVSRFGSSRLFAKTAVVPVAEPPKAARHLAKESKPNPFHKALEAATSHDQPKLKKARWHHGVARKLHIKPKSLNIGAAVLAVVLISGFILSQNRSNLSVRLAAARAGFHASMPSYHPSGFALKGPIHYTHGELTLNFQSNSDARNFQVKQQSSSWNSETLLEAYVTKQNQPYQTYEDNGRTVYIDNTSANLVTGNKWVQVTSDGSLSTEQLLNIAKSIN